ncbi:unnamed protein product [Gadus morhua 'NCC']
MVDISCTYEYADNIQHEEATVNSLWFTKGDKSQPVDLEHDTNYTGRVEYSCGEIHCQHLRCHGTCTLRIKDLRHSDSAVYKFRFTTRHARQYTGDPGVTLSVTDLRVKVSIPSPVSSPDWTKLECLSTCDLAGDPTYIWFRNGLNVGDGKWYWNQPEGGEIFSCAVEGYEDLRSPVVSLQGNNGEGTVTYPQSSLVCTLRGATADLDSTYEYPYDVQYNPTTVKTLWFTKGNKSQHTDLLSDADYTGRVESSCGEVSCTGSRCHGTCTLRIKDLRLTDSATYKFRFTTNHPKGEYPGDPEMTLSVTDLQVKLYFPYAVDPTYAKLNCVKTCGQAGDTPYIWFKNGQNVGRGEHYMDYSQSGNNYSCAVEGYHLRSPLVYAPKTPSVTISPSGEVEEGSSVTLSCSSDANPGATYTWFRLITGHSSRETKQGPYLVFRRILSSDSGRYYCLVQTVLRTTSELINIMVKYGPKHASALPSPSGEIKEGSSVTLSCSSDANPAAEYTWFKNNQPLLWEPSQPHTFPSVRPEDRGTYRCHAENQYGQLGSNSIFMDVKYAPMTPSVTVSPSGEIEEGSSVTLSCSSDANPAAEYTWFKDHGSVRKSGQNHTITNITSELGGNYYCQAHNEIGHHDTTFLFIKVTSSSQRAMVAVTTIGFLLATILLLLAFLWMRRKRSSSKVCGQGGRPDTVEEVLALNNHLAAAPEREEIEEKDDFHYAIPPYGQH